MINLTRMLRGPTEPTLDPVREETETRPGILWSITRRCNLRCLHCYSDSDARQEPDKLDWTQCRAFINDLADFRVPSLLFSGGEPLLHPLFFFAAKYAAERGLRLALYTNGTLLDAEAAEKLRQIGFDQVSISMDGIGFTHDHFTGSNGAFQKAVHAFRYCREVGQPAGLRLTLTRQSAGDLDRILDFVEEEKIERVSFCHLVNSGRGARVAVLSPEQTRRALDKIMDRVEHWNNSGNAPEVLTLDQPADRAYLWMRLSKQDTRRANTAEKLFRAEAGKRHAIASIDSQGFVSPDPFWQTRVLGNVREQPFSKIWRESKDPVLENLRSHAKPHKGRCGRCRFYELCRGSFRMHAWQRYGDAWAEEPSCYLRDQEIYS